MGSTTDRKTDGKADRPTPAPRRMLDKAPVSPGSKRSKDSASGSDNDAQLPPERADPAILAAAEKQRLAELRRRGRSSTFLAGGKRTINTAPLGRPQAGSGQLGA